MKKLLLCGLCLLLCACATGGGSDGAPGAPGTPGKSAYEIWLEAGNSGTEQDFLNSLVGANGQNGNDGTPGKSAYEKGFGTSSGSPFRRSRTVLIRPKPCKRR